MIVENVGNAPQTIEKICYDYNLPSKYKLADEFTIPDNGPVEAVISRYYEPDGSFLIIIQSTKRSFTQPVIVGEDICSPAEIKGCNGFTIEHTEELGDGSISVINDAIWECGEYVHTVVGYNISMKEVMSIVDGMTEKQAESNI